MVKYILNNNFPQSLLYFQVPSVFNVYLLLENNNPFPGRDNQARTSFEILSGLHLDVRREAMSRPIQNLGLGARLREQSACLTYRGTWM